MLCYGKKGNAILVRIEAGQLQGLGVKIGLKTLLEKFG